MEDRLSSMTQKMLELQIKYLDLQKKSSDEIISLHDKLHKVLHETTFSQKGKKNSSNRIRISYWGFVEWISTFSQAYSKQTFEIPF